MWRIRDHKCTFFSVVYFAVNEKWKTTVDQGGSWTWKEALVFWQRGKIEYFHGKRESANKRDMSDVRVKMEFW